MAWKKPIQIFESHDVVRKMYLKYKLHTIQMRENENVIKHIHSFKFLLEQLSTTGSFINEDDL